MMLKNIFKRQEIRFLFVGGLNTLVGYGLYAIFLMLNVNYLIANTLSTVLGVLHSYLWNRFFTFKSKEKAGKEIVKFVSVYIISYLLGTATLFCFTSLLQLSPYIAGFINLFITTLISFFGHKYFSFSSENGRLIFFLKKHQDFVCAFGIFLFSFLILLMYRNIPNFTDEGDVMLGAMMLSKGKLIYVDFASQHLPFTYYLFSLFAFLGVHSVLGFRLSLYFLLALVWAFMYLRYNKAVGKIVLILYPFMYILYMSVPDFYSATLLSEHIEAQCLVILFLEVLLFFKNQKIDLLGKILIPITMVISILSAFVSIIPCFAILITLFYIDIKNFVKKKKGNFKAYIFHFWNEYKILLLVGIGSVSLFVLYLIITGSFKECIYQAFYLNTEIYSKYNGYSSNPLITMVKIFPDFLLRLPYYLHVQFVNILYLLLWSGVFFFFVSFFRKDKGLAILLSWAILLAGNRGFEGFHATPYYAVAIIALLTAVCKLPKKYFFVFVLIFLVLFIKQCYSYYSTLFMEKEVSSYYETVRLLDNSEYSLHVDVNTTAYIDSNTLPISRFSGMVPWFAEVYEEEYLKDIRESRMKILFYNPYEQIWGYRFCDYIPKVHEYILENYTYVEDYSLWILNDYFVFSEEILQIDLAEYTNAYKIAEPFALANNYIEQVLVPEKDISKIGFKIGTYERTNYSIVHIEVYEGNELLFRQEMTASNLEDNEMFYLEQNFEKNHTYTIRFYSEYTNNTDYVAFYKVQDEENLDANYLKINGYIYDEDLVMEMYYE